MYLLIPPIFFLAVMLGAVLLGALLGARTRRAWAALARSRSLSPRPDGRLVGTVGGLTVQVYQAPGEQLAMELRGRQYTVAEAAVPELSQTFLMHTGWTIFQAFGSAMAPEPGLDRALQLLYLVPNYRQYPRIAAALAEPALLQVLIEAARGQKVLIDGGKVRVLAVAPPENERTLAKLLESALEVARAFSAALTRSS